MKWIAIFSAVMNGIVAELPDADNPEGFKSRRACLHYVMQVRPKAERIMRDYFALETGIKVRAECRRLDLN